VLVGTASQATDAISQAALDLLKAQPSPPGVPVRRILGTAGMCTSDWTRHLEIPRDVRAELLCIKPLLPIAQYPGGLGFAADYQLEYHREPNAYALFGYETMRLALRAIAALGSQGDNRAAVLQRIMMGDEGSPLGSFTFSDNGDTSLTSVALYRVTLKGSPSYDSKLEPPSVLGSP
jgi:hypothetical protein